MFDAGLTPHAAAAMIGPQMFDAAACRKWVVVATRGQSPCCPACGVFLSDREVQRLLDGKGIACAACGVHSSPRSGTILEGSTLSDAQVVFILALLHWELPAYQIAKLAGCSPATVYNWQHRVSA